MSTPDQPDRPGDTPTADDGDDPITAARRAARVHADRWHTIFRNTHHTPQTWACVAAAIHTADAALPIIAAAAPPPGTLDPFGPAVRGGPHWCRIAVAAYTALADSNAYAHLPTPTPRECVADPDTIRLWLTAPFAAPGMEAATNAWQHGVDDTFLADDDDRPRRLANLLAEAQYVAAFGVPGHQVELWHLADNDGDLDGHRLAVTPPTGPVFTSGLLYVDDLTDDTRTGVDAAVDFLTTAARIVTDLLPTPAALAPQPDPTRQPAPAAEPEPVPAWVHGYPIGQPGRAFPPPPAPVSTVLGPPAGAHPGGTPPPPPAPPGPDPTRAPTR